ncbi:RNA-splicing ligase RtcB [Acetobacterium bakii]|uniref:3'-phosphate/5'-hydroxy nucleic acid ligase n=1 Tax=Acetobacterium bakii TaxID=52689 RepID=A0A0L6U4S8_9FIRM|nr:RNA-splicing ligase RtcB [Acetobacterium bakii]KNZ43508.1 hypothetical protein AKG39_00990 [Acetobacterium bakii]
MIEIIGKYNKSDVFTDELEPATYQQILDMCNLEYLKDAVIKIMPDCHVGTGCTIGTTILFEDDHPIAINPLHVGVDIGCGVKVSKLINADVNFKQLDSVIRNKIPVGFAVHKKKIGAALDFINALNCKKKLTNIDRLACSLGTLGSGNHFIEIDTDSSGKNYLLVHSGSRNLGLQVANFYGSISNRDGFLSVANTQDYLQDMLTCQTFATKNRDRISSTILKEMGIKEVESFHTIHNYIEKDAARKYYILRKGAVSANAGEQLVIPLNMRDGSLLAVGKGNLDWNYSAPHGAGRILSRSQAKKKLDLVEFKKEMEGIYSTSVSKSTLDESPMAYKNISEILKYVGETVKIIDTLKSVYNFKA